VEALMDFIVRFIARMS
jgi:hypothetical protein